MEKVEKLREQLFQMHIRQCALFVEIDQICIDEWKIVFSHLRERERCHVFFFQNLLTEFLKHVRESWNTRNSRKGACAREQEREGERESAP